MELQVFKNQNFGEIRTTMKDGKPWFIGKDIADVLGYSNTKDALQMHVDSEDKLIAQRSGNATFDIPNRGITIINESGLYSLILKSKLPGAKQFKRWVTSEVLPTIRKYGMFAADELLNNPDFMIKTFQKLKSERDQKLKFLKQIQSDKPYTKFGKAITTSDKGILIGEFSKLLKNDGIDIGQNKLFGWMRLNGYLISRGLRKNQPLQKYVERGLFIIKETIMHVDGEKKIQITPLITGKGQLYFLNKLKRLVG
jgi:anti-repressor protein